MIFYVFQKPAVVLRLRDEIDAVIKADKDITADNIKKLVYLECIINEISRIFWSASGLFEREFVQNTMFGGVPLQKGTCIVPIWAAMFHDPNIFDNPLEFMPERW
jgi:cytochrome P450